jgi:hypothetical protein
MPKQPASSKPFLIARPAPSDRVIFARAYASLGRSNKLLQQGSPSSFLGDQHYEPFSLAGETERTPKVDQIILTDQQLLALTHQSIEQRIVPPLCPHCDINMKWYRSKQAKQSAKIIENLFSCPNCNRIARVASWCRA